MGIPPSDAERLKIERGDALPPAGYGAQDDFGDFGDFGNNATGDFASGVDFGDDFGADAVSAPTATATAAPDDSPYGFACGFGRSVRFGLFRSGAAAIGAGRRSRPKRSGRSRATGGHQFFVRQTGR